VAGRHGGAHRVADLQAGEKKEGQDGLKKRGGKR
jgi:hypothetical protein